MSEEGQAGEAHAGGAAAEFDEREMDKIIRQIVDKVRGTYFEYGEGARGMPGEVKKIIDAVIDRV